MDNVKEIEQELTERNIRFILTDGTYGQDLKRDKPLKKIYVDRFIGSNLREFLQERGYAPIIKDFNNE